MTIPLGAPVPGGEGLDPGGAGEARPDDAAPLQPEPPATVDRLTELIRLAQGYEEAGRLKRPRRRSVAPLPWPRSTQRRSICSASSVFARVESTRRRL